MGPVVGVIGQIGRHDGGFDFVVADVAFVGFCEVVERASSSDPNRPACVWPGSMPPFLIW